jgi:hypothetical protein
LFLLPVLAGILTPENPLFTAVVLALGSIPPLNDMPPISIGIWPIEWFAKFHDRRFLEFPIVLILTTGTVMVMTIPYAALVAIGWRGKLKFER